MIVPTRLRVRHDNGRRTRTSRKSSAMYVTHAPVPRYAGKKLNFQRRKRDASDSGMLDGAGVEAGAEVRHSCSGGRKPGTVRSSKRGDEERRASGKLDSPNDGIADSENEGERDGHFDRHVDSAGPGDGWKVVHDELDSDAANHGRAESDERGDEGGPPDPGARFTPREVERVREGRFDAGQG